MAELNTLAADDGDEIDLLGLAIFLWGEKWRIIAVAICVVLIGIATYIALPREYQANAKAYPFHSGATAS
jgi:LPS O-antigen subunit length determinant protein (WzzB/FepE family)